MMPSEKRVNRMYNLIQIGYFGMVASFEGFRAAMVLDRGFSSGDAGIFMALTNLAGLVAMPFLGSWADKHPEVPLKRLFALMMVPALAINFLFYFTRPGWWGTALIFLLLGVLEFNSTPLLDSMAMQYLDVGVNVNYSLGRGLGAFSYAVVCAAVGWQTARWGIQTALLTHGVLAVVMILLVVIFPELPKKAYVGAEKKTRSALEILRANIPYTVMLVACFFGMMSTMPTSSFLVNMITEQGGNSGHLGLAMFLMAASELPGGIMFHKLRGKLGTEKILLMVLCFAIVKSVLFLCVDSLFLLLAVQPVQMLCFGLFPAAITYFTNENIPPEDRVQGQTLKTVITMGMGGMVGCLFAGKAIDIGGTGLMLGLCAAFGAVGLLLGVYALRLGRRQRG